MNKKNKRGLNRNKKLLCQIGKKNKNGTVKSKKRVSISKRKKKAADTKKGCLTEKTKQKKITACPHHFAKAAMFTAFVPVLVAALRAGACRRPSCQCSSPPWGRRCWLRSACGGSQLGAWRHCWVQGLSF